MRPSRPRAWKSCLTALPCPYRYPQSGKETEAKVEDLPVELRLGQTMVRDEMILCGVVLGATKVRNIWMRNDPVTRYKRML